MDHDRELDRLVALLEEHAITPEYESDELDEEHPWGHPLIYERVRARPWFPFSADEVRALLEWRPEAFRPPRWQPPSSG